MGRDQTRSPYSMTWVVRVLPRPDDVVDVYISKHGGGACIERHTAVLRQTPETPYAYGHHTKTKTDPCEENASTLWQNLLRRLASPRYNEARICLAQSADHRRCKGRTSAPPCWPWVLGRATAHNSRAYDNADIGNQWRGWCDRAFIRDERPPSRGVRPKKACCVESGVEGQGGRRDGGRRQH